MQHSNIATCVPWLVRLALVPPLTFAGLVGPTFAALPPAPWYPTILTTEHADVFAVGYNSGWSLSVDDEDNLITYAPNNVFMYVDRSAKTAQPAGAQWNFLGAGAGNPVWILPQSQNPSLLYAGANAYRVNAAFFPPYFESDPRINATGRWIKESLIDLRGPGQFSVYQTNSFGTPTPWIASADGISSSDALFTVPGAHGHLNWAFTQRGVYEIDLQASGYLGANKTNPTASAVTTYYFGVETQLSLPVSVASLNNASVVNFDVAARPVTLADAGDGLLTPIATRYDASGNLYVADVLRSRITRITPGGVASTFADLADGVTTPSGMTFDAAGNLYVSNYLTNTIAKITPAGVGTTFAGPTAALDSPFGMATNAAGTVFVADLADRQIVALDGSGNATVFADAGDGLLAPFGVAVDTLSNVYVSDVLTSRIYKFTPGGVGSIFADASDGVVTPAGLAFDSNGDLYAADYLTNRILRIDPSGATFLYADSADGISSPFDVAAKPHVASGSLSLLGGGLNFVAETRFAHVPEPGAAVLAAVGLAALGAWGAIERIRRRRGSTFE